MDLHYFAELCEISYLPPTEIKQKLIKDKPTIIDIDNTRCTVFKKLGKLVIVLTGTNEPDDVRDDLNMFRKKFFSITGNYCGKVHSGFIDHYINIRGLLLTHIMDYIKKPEDYPELIFTGHSLGGVCALAALDISYLPDMPRISVYTFGSPRIGNHTFAHKFNKKIHKSIRVANEYDIVTMIPTMWRFRHVDDSKILKTKFTFARFWNKMKSLCNGKLSALTGDHDISDYIRKLT